MIFRGEVSGEQDGAGEGLGKDVIQRKACFNLGLRIAGEDIALQLISPEDKRAGIPHALHTCTYRCMCGHRLLLIKSVATPVSPDKLF